MKYQKIDCRNKKAPNKKEIEKKVKQVMAKLKRKKLFLTAIESCTGGGLINALTNLEGASEITKGARIAYSDEDKINLGVPKSLIKKYTVYSPEVAVAMAKTSLKQVKGSHLGLGITGLIGRKDPRFPQKQPNTIDIACVFKNKVLAKRFIFPKLKRPKIKDMAIMKVLEMVEEILS